MNRRSGNPEGSWSLAPLVGVLLSLLAHGAIAASLWLRSGGSEPSPTPRLAGIREVEPIQIRWVSSGPLPLPSLTPPREEIVFAPLSPELDGALPHPAPSERRALPVPAPTAPTFPGPVSPLATAPLVLPSPEEQGEQAEPLPPPRPAAQLSARSGPVLADRIEPVYPRSCLLARHEGVVELLLEVDSRGRVTGATLVERSSCRELDESARRAALRLRYEPAREAGRAVAGEARLTVRFVLER